MSAVKIRKKLKKSEFSDSEEGSKLLLSLLSIQNPYCSSESNLIQLNIGCFDSCCKKENPEIMELRHLEYSQAKRPSCQWCQKISLEIRQLANLQQISSFLVRL